MAKKSYDYDGSNFVTWIGNTIENEMAFQSYRKCIFNEYVLNIGEYIYIYHPDEPKNQNKNCIVKICLLIENVELALDSKYQAIVESYIRPFDLPDEVKKLDLDFNKEIILNADRVYIIPLHSVRGKCNVIRSEPGIAIPDIPEDIQNTYICRYKMITTNGKLSLMAVNGIPTDNENSVQDEAKNQHETENIFRSTNGDNSNGDRKNLNSSFVDAGENSLMMGLVEDFPHRNKNDLKLAIKDSRKESHENANFVTTPLKAIQYNDELDNLPKRHDSSTPHTPKTPKSILKSCSIHLPQTVADTPRFFVSFNVRENRSTLDLEVDRDSSLDQTWDETLETPTNKTRKTPSKTPKKTRIAALEAVISERKTPIRKDLSDVQLAKESLHVSAVPKTLPCLENEFKNIYKFIESKISDKSSGCMYISGVPGTGKTATVTEVIRLLQLQAERKKVPSFEFVEINGMRLTEPRQAYVQIYHQLTKVKVSWEQALLLLEKRFTTPTLHRKTTVLVVDELDILCNRRQDVIYNLLDWPTKKGAQLVALTIANTLDLPERFLMGRVTSRLGLTRLTFQPYSHKQLQEIVLARLTGTNIFENDALQLVARKVASISGDCRRALDICRRATEIGEADCAGEKVMVSMLHVEKAFSEMITNPKVLAIKGCSKYEKLFLQAVEAEVARTGVDETVLFQVYRQLESICALNGVPVPEPGIALRMSSRLGSSRLLICEHSSASIHQKIMLNVMKDDLYYALHVNNDK